MSARALANAIAIFRRKCKKDQQGATTSEAENDNEPRQTSKGYDPVPELSSIQEKPRRGPSKPFGRKAPKSGGFPNVKKAALPRRRTRRPAASRMTSRGRRAAGRIPSGTSAKPKTTTSFKGLLLQSARLSNTFSSPLPQVNNDSDVSSAGHLGGDENGSSTNASDNEGASPKITMDLASLAASIYHSNIQMRKKYPKKKKAPLKKDDDSDEQTVEVERKTWSRWVRPNTQKLLAQRARLHKKARNEFFEEMTSGTAREYVGNLDEGEDTTSPLLVFVETCHSLSLPLIPIALPRRGATLLDFSGYGFSEEYSVALAKCIRLGACEQAFEGIQRVNLNDNSIGVWGCKAIIDASQNSSISSIALARNALGRHGAWMCAEQLHMNSEHTCLREIEIPGNDIGSYGAQLLAQALLSNTALTSLDISRNNIGILGAKAFGRLLAKTETLRCLNLSWNGISGVGALSIAVAFEKNTSLRALDIGWNSFGQCGADLIIAQTIARQPTLRRLDLSYNEIGCEGGIALAWAFRFNSKMEDLLLNGNALGVATISLVGVIASSLPNQSRRLSISQCSLRGECELFDPRSPGGSYVLDMASPYHAGIATDILAMGVHAGTIGTSTENVLLDRKPYHLDLRSAEPWKHLPQKGVLQFDFIWHTSPPNMSNALNSTSFDAVYDTMIDPKHEGEETRFKLLEHTCSDLSFTCAQAAKLVKMFHTMSFKKKAVAMMIMQIANPDQRHAVLDLLPPFQQILMQKRLHNFDRVNPTGHYCLDLSIPIERSIALRLSELSTDERQQRRQSRKPDLSQNGTGYAWRNETLDNVPITFDLDFRVPDRGILELDFVQHSRPGIGDCDPMKAGKFDDLLTQLQHILFDEKDAEKNKEICPGDRALGVVRQMSREHLFLMEQARVIVQCFPDASNFEGQTDFQVEAYVALYSRILNEYEARLLLPMFNSEQKTVLMQRLGYLALWSPFQAEGSYSLKLDRSDARRVCQALLCLSLVEKGCDMRNCKFNGVSVETPALWLVQMPETGKFSCEIAQTERPKEATRSRLADQTLGWGKHAIHVITNLFRKEQEQRQREKAEEEARQLKVKQAAELLANKAAEFLSVPDETDAS